ncbi:(Fe-S)-binding protein [Ferroglobus placidus]|nr:(Fe-S)-binding protein [Ferroglobus placidus]
MEVINPKILLEFATANMRKSGTPVGLLKEEVNSWWEGFEIKREGEWFFFTGLLYQLTPYIEKTVEKIEILEKLKMDGLIRFSKFAPSKILKFFASPKKERIAETKNIVRSIYKLLERAGINVWYDPELDFYSGVLLYELGEEEKFEKHAKLVIESLEKAGVKKIVTIDPHTTYALKHLYPENTFEVASYIELVKDLKGNVKEEVVIHDPCYYSRYLKLYEDVREILSNFGIAYRDVRNSKELTSCCGGPVEGLSARVAKEVAKLRVNELGREKIVTSCPICVSNLRRAGGNVVDLAQLISKENF